MRSSTDTSLWPRLVGAFGAIACASAVALGAYSAHAASELARSRLDTAVLYLFFHGLALVVLAPRQRGWLERGALAAFVFGIFAFCGSLIGGALWHTSTALAPLGGSAFTWAG